MDEAKKQLIEEIKEALLRMQQFDVETLPRIKELGTSMSFDGAVEPATRLIQLYNQLPVETLESISVTQLNTVKKICNNDFSVLNEALTLEPGNPVDVRDNIIKKIQQCYDPTFDALHPVISYSVRKSTDFAKLETDARAALQSIEDKANALETSMENHEEQARKVLENIQKVAAEQGVSQQAFYFKSEAQSHFKYSIVSLAITVVLAIVLVITAVQFLNWNVDIQNENIDKTYAMVQLAVSKVLVFATLSFLLAFAAKNFMASKHNEVINKHRENALKTYTALVEAAGDEANRDIVLTKASESIFTTQTTGFGKSDGTDGKALSMLSIAPTALKQITDSN